MQLQHEQQSELELEVTRSHARLAVEVEIEAANSGASQLRHSFPEARKPSFLDCPRSAQTMRETRDGQII